MSLTASGVSQGAETESFQNVGGRGDGVYDVLTLQKSRGARTHPGGAKAPLPPPPNAVLQAGPC